MRKTFGVMTMFCGLGGKTLGFLRAQSKAGSRFESIAAFDIEAEACTDFKTITGDEATQLDIGALTPGELRDLCPRRPDVVIGSPPCKGFSGCLPMGMAKTKKYQDLNALALYSLDLVLEAWDQPPAFILWENVPRMLCRGATLLRRAKALLAAKGYEVDLRVHDCGEVGGLAQSRDRVLLVARHRELAPTPLLRPPAQGLRSMASVLWDLPVPTPDSDDGGPMHRLPRLSTLNWVRLAAIRAGRDWRDLPAQIRMAGDPRLPGDDRRHAGKYGVQDGAFPAHTVLSEARTGKGWADVADPRLAPRAARQNGGFGVNDSAIAGHTVLADGSVRNTWVSVADPRLKHVARDGGSHGVADPDRPSVTVLGRPGIANGTAAVVDPRVKEQFRGAFGVQDDADASACVRATHGVRTAPASVSDPRHFVPTHRLIAGPPLDASREDWTAGAFELLGDPLDVAKKGSPTHVIIVAPDGTVHRPLTTLELAMLQGLPVWHRPGDPRELEVGGPGGQWLQLTGSSQARWRERIGNAVPPPTAQAIAVEVLEILDAGAEEVFRLSAGGIWVEQAVQA